jgi:hypothetical protein
MSLEVWGLVLLLLLSSLCCTVALGEVAKHGDTHAYTHVFSQDE